MGIRFRKSFKICKGLRMNLSKSGASMSVGGKGHWLTTGPKGTHISTKIPGTPMYYTQKIGCKSRSRSSKSGARSSSWKWVIIIGLIIGFFVKVILATGGK